MKTLRLPLFFSLPLLLGSDTSVDLSCSLLAMADSSSLALAFVRPGSATPAFLRGNRSLSQLPKRPFTASPCSPTPGSPAHLTFNGAWARPPHISTTKAPPNSFRGSITRLYSSLPTLEGGLSAYQPRVASGDRSGPSGRGSHPLGLDRDFPLLPCFFHFHLFPSLWALAGATKRLESGRFSWPQEGMPMEMEREEFLMLLGGLEWQTTRRKAWYRHRKKRLKRDWINRQVGILFLEYSC
ncbi:MAG: hypothetical protein HOI66_15385 [Verrucomicrobia bacterium]|jgi:hypothetical protein|nr:hypothetical protein [Verrucomicrobiota bacterium]